MADETIKCTFCEGAMVVTTKVDGMIGESGGTWNSSRFACPACQALVVHDVTEKVGNVSETWQLERVPTHATRRLALHCPSCDGQLVSAWHPQARPHPVVSFSATSDAATHRSTDHACLDCGARYVLREMVQSSWFTAKTSGPENRTLMTHEPIGSPLPYPRRP